MKCHLSRRNKWMIFSVFLIFSLLWFERERRVLTIVGTWQIVERGAIESDSNFHFYYVFH